MVLIIITITVLVIYFYLKHTQLKTYWKKKHVKYLEPLPLVGNYLPMLRKKISAAEFIKNLYNAFPTERYLGVFQFNKPILVVRDPDLIKQITIKQFDSFINHQPMVQPDVDPLWSKSLFGSTGDRWVNLRRILSPAFTSSKMRSMFVLIGDCCVQLTDFLKNQNQNIAEHEMKDIFSRLTSDVIASTAFGIQCNSLENPKNEFIVMGRDLTNMKGFNKLKMFLCRFPAVLLKACNIKIVSDKVGGFFRSIVKKTLDVRAKNNIIRPDLIHLLTEARKGRLVYEEGDVRDTDFLDSETTLNKIQPVKQEMTDEDITAQALNFFFGGFDTVSSHMSFVAYELCHNPLIQKKLQNEIDQILRDNNDKVTYEALFGMKYMDMVICESLRKWPQAIWIDRVANKPFTIEQTSLNEKDVKLETGEICLIPIFGIHRDPQYYENPDEFIPERFSEANKSNINPYTYMPFGSGPRNCIGNRFALLVNKLAFFHVLAHFDIVPTEKSHFPLVLDENDLLLSAKHGFWFGFKQRSSRH